MCGIAGFLRMGGAPPERAGEILRAMTGRLAHRGPDGEGAWVDGEAGVALGHRRLSVLELSPAGAQPMLSPDGARVVAFNGEIYNHLNLRAELERDGPVAWRGRSDTETLLTYIERFGMDRFLERASGMFAFALHDRRARTLFLARDRMGEKPLYYGLSRGTFLFASEPKAFAAHPSFRAEVDPAALALYFRHGYVPAPRSIYRGIRKLPPGSLLELPLSRSAGPLPEPRVWWSLERVAARGLADPFPGSDEEAADELESRLARSVSLQRVADVPLGAFLSGGIDSSTVAALMRAPGARPPRTFTIGFRERAFDESGHARAVAAHLGTDHTERIVTPAEAREVIPDLSRVFCEPFGDASAVPTLLVCRLARRDVTVALSGDGGDELFFGYERYRRATAIHARLSRLPGTLRALLAASCCALPLGALDRAAGACGLRGGGQPLAEKVAALEGMLRARSDAAFYRAKFSLWKDPASLVALGAAESAGPAERLPERAGLAERMMLADATGYLPDDILVKVDRAAMDASLETRVPLLDPEVVAFAWRLPARMRMRDGRMKWLLRKVLLRHVPAQLVDRPKRGFAIPAGEWIRGPLRDWADDLLSPAALSAHGLLRPAPFLAAWADHRAGRFDHGETLWPALMFQAWMRTRG